MDLMVALNSKIKGRFFIGWWLVAVAAIGISAGPGPFAFASLGLFMLPLEEEFGWNRAEISSALTLLIIVTAFSLPIVGRMVDRIGVRHILITSLITMGFCLAAIPALMTKLWHLSVIFIFIGTLGAGTNSVPYMRALSAWFVKYRGLAMGLAMAGIGLGYFYVPLLLQFMIVNYGWRSGWYALSAIVFFVALPLIFLFFRDSPEDVGVKPDGADIAEIPKAASRDVGYTTTEVLRRPEFWMLVAIFIVLSFVLNGIIPHLVPMLSDRGMTISSAAIVASVIGAAVFIGRIVIGYLIDRFFAPYVALFFFSLSALGLGLFALGATGPMAFVAAALIGLSLGAEVDILAYLTSRYFGLRSFGSIYGLFFSAILFGTAFGPLTFGLAFEATGSYVSILTACVFINIIAIVITAFLRPYPDWEKVAVEA